MIQVIRAWFLRTSSCVNARSVMLYSVISLAGWCFCNNTDVTAYLHSVCVCVCVCVCVFNIFILHAPLL